MKIPAIAVEITANAIAFPIAFKVVAKSIFTDDEIDSQVWFFCAVSVAVEAVGFYFLDHRGLSFISSITFLILAWKLMGMKLPDAFRFSIAWGITSFIIGMFIFAFLGRYGLLST